MARRALPVPGRRRVAGLIARRRRSARRRLLDGLVAVRTAILVGACVVIPARIQPSYRKAVGPVLVSAGVTEGVQTGNTEEARHESGQHGVGQLRVTKAADASVHAVFVRYVRDVTPDHLDNKHKTGKQLRKPPSEPAAT
jgi:hypothetical protein